MTGLELWWLGQAGFRLREPGGEATVFLDPFVTQREDRSWQAPVDAAALAGADLILCSHEHIDHLDRPALKAAADAPGSRFTLVVPWPLLDMVYSDIGLGPERVIGTQPDEPIERGGVLIY